MTHALASGMTQSKPYIALVGVDYSELGDLAFQRALEITASQPNAELHVVHVAYMVLNAGDVEHALASNTEQRSKELQAKLVSYVERQIAPFVQQGPPQAPSRIVPHLRWEAPADEIAQLAADLDADLVVVGTHGRRGLSRLMMGSVAENVVRLAPCPVLVVRPKGLVKVPAIEPPCPECVKTRTATEGAEFWCEQHRERHGQRHTYHQSDRISKDGTMPLVFHG
jgi:nucleotide-binding universal stress UspA family protein